MIAALFKPRMRARDADRRARAAAYTAATRLREHRFGKS
jgi:hypothetical protein